MSDGRRTELIEGAEGPRLAKVAIDDDGRRLIAQEASRLAAARHPGVVELVHHDHERIELAWAGDRTIELAAYDIAGAAALLAAVAATVADLHDLGSVHGRLDLTHVIVGPDGGPRLCGMSGPRAGEPEPIPSVDVAALGRMIHRLVGDSIAVEPIPERRWRRRRWSGYQQRALLNLADQALADDVGRRPSARTLATSIAAVAPGARLARPSTGVPGPREPVAPTDIAEPRETAEPVDVDEPDHGVEIRDVLERPEPVHEPASTPAATTRAAEPRRPKSRVVVAAAVAAAVLVAGAMVGRHPDEAPAAGGAPARTAGTGVPPTEPPPPGTDQVGGTTSPQIDHLDVDPPPRCTPVVGLAADVDDDGCPDPVVIEGTTITAGATVFRAGTADDHVAVGDWRCTGRITPGLVRPATGEVFLFDRWPDDDTPVEVDPVAIVPGGARLVVGENTCGAPGVESTAGALTHLDLTEEAG